MSKRPPDSRTWRLGYWRHLMDNGVERVNKKIFLKKGCITKQLLTGFEDNSSFVWPSNGSVALSLQLRATDLLSGQTKLLLSSNPVNYCILLQLHVIMLNSVNLRVCKMFVEGTIFVILISIAQQRCRLIFMILSSILIRASWNMWMFWI